MARSYANHCTKEWCQRVQGCVVVTRVQDCVGAREKRRLLKERKQLCRVQRVSKRLDHTNAEPGPFGSRRVGSWTQPRITFSTRSRRPDEKIQTGFVQGPCPLTCVGWFPTWRGWERMSHGVNHEVQTVTGTTTATKPPSMCKFFTPS